MPSFIVKPKPDEDFYVEYSTVVDAPTRWADKAEWLRVEPQWTDRIARADEHGSSCHAHDTGGCKLGWYWWDDTEFTIMEGPGGPGTINRDQLRAYCEAQESDEPTAAAMVKPADWYDD